MESLNLGIHTKELLHYETPRFGNGLVDVGKEDLVS